MAFKFAVLAALCIAQGFAFKPLNMMRDEVICKNPTLEISTDFQQTLEEMDEIRESVSMAAMEAYGSGNNFKVIIACFREQRPNYIKLGERVSEMVDSASRVLAEELVEKADRYEKLIQEPLRTIAVTLRELPETVYTLIQNKQYLKAIQVVREARNIVEENSIVVAGHLRDMAAEIPALAEKADALAKEIYEESRTASLAIRQAFEKCVEEGGPKAPVSEE